MPEHAWLALGLTAIGTFLIRLLPLLWMQRRLAKRQCENAVEALPPWLSVLGPMMIAAMLGVSLVPPSPSTLTWLATLVGIIATLLTWIRLRSLGWPVLVGVAGYTLVILAAGFIS